MKYLPFMIAILFMSCGGPGDNTSKQAEETGTTMAENLIGEWFNVSMRITTHSMNHTDSTDIFDVPAGNWEAALGIKPIRTRFAKDETYTSVYRSLIDSIIAEREGLWHINGDSLIMHQSIPVDETFVYHCTLKDSFMEFRGMLDWDGDGLKDDEYFGVQKKALETD